MKISLSLEDLEPIVVAEVLAVVHKHKDGKIPATEAAYLAAVKDAAPETAAPETAAPEAGSSDDSEPTPADTGEPSEADLIIASLDEQFKRAKTATIMDGVQAKPEDEVIIPEGETGVIVAVYRGRAVVEFEDGTAAEFKAAELKAAPQGDEPPAEQPKDEAPTEEKPSRRRRQKEEPEEEEELEGVALAKSLAEQLDNDTLKSILGEFDAESLAELEDFDDADLGEFIDVLKDEIKANA